MICQDSMQYYIVPNQDLPLLYMPYQKTDRITFTGRTCNATVSRRPRCLVLNAKAEGEQRE